jgi:hypothetical protein
MGPSVTVAASSAGDEVVDVPAASRRAVLTSTG